MRRRQALVAAALAPWMQRARAIDPARLTAGRLTADFEPLAAVWMGHDAGHAAFTAALAAALGPFVPLKLLVRDAEAEAAARALLAEGAPAVERVQFVHDAAAPFFMRDAAVFAHDGQGRAALVDLRWSHYGWARWCAQRHGKGSAEARSCASAEAGPIDALEERLAERLGAALFRSPLAMEGGGVEVNGQGLLIANQELWLGRNPTLDRAAIERELLRLPGVRRVIWLPQGLAHDPLHRATITGRHVAWGTGGHTDQFVRFADERTVLLAWPEPDQAARHPVARLNLQRMRRNAEVLAAATDLRGRRLRVLRVPLPHVVERPVELNPEADTRLARGWTPESFAARERRRAGDTLLHVASTSWLNFVVANDVLVLPDYQAHGSPPALQARAERVLAQAFPGRQLRTVDAMGANWVGGGAHCATLGEPRSV
ncbi:MAG: agmatine deiminase family protein [Rubrivivax sp.]